MEWAILLPELPSCVAVCLKYSKQDHTYALGKKMLMQSTLNYSYNVLFVLFMKNLDSSLAGQCDHKPHNPYVHLENSILF